MDDFSSPIADGMHFEQLGSADWMPRNLYERVEVMFPIKDPSLRHRIYEEILQNYLKDNDKARILQPDGSYKRMHDAAHSVARRNGRCCNVQDLFINLAQERAEPAVAEAALDRTN